MKKQQILILSLSFLLNWANGQVLFTPTPHIIQETDTYEFTVAGDLDNDNTDEVVIFENPLSDHRAIHIFDIDVNGQFTPLQVIDLDVSIGNPVLEDADNDGDLDIVSFDFAFEVFYFENLGNLIFSATPTTFYSSNSNNQPIKSFHFFDFDMDGDQDFLVSVDPDHYLMENDNGSYVFNQELNLEYEQNLTFYSFDLDQDNDLDLVIKDNYDVRFSYNENGIFTLPKFALDIPNFYATQLAIGDIDQDNDVDIGYVSVTSEYFTLALNDGSDTIFTDVEEYEFSAIQTGFDVKFIDIDSDNDLDVFLGSSNHATLDEQEVAWLKNMGGSFELKYAPKPTFLTKSGWTHLSAVEIDGDNNLELVAVSGHQSYNRIYSLEFDNSLDSMVIMDTYQDSANNFLHIRTGDLNADGKDDICAFNISSKNITTFFNQFPNENLSSQEIISNVGIVSNNLVDQALLDLNGDGHLDIIYSEKISIFNTNGNTYLLYYQPNTNNFSDSILVASTPLQGFRSFDADGDGDLDLICTDNANNNSGYVFLKNVDNLGTYEPPVHVFANYFYSLNYNFDHGDLDNDTDEDLVFYSQQNINGDIIRKLIWMENDGNANFTNPIVLDSFPFNYFVGNLRVTDMNGDGFKDIIYHTKLSSISAPVNDVRILFNINGTGEFAPPNIIHTSEEKYFQSHNFYTVDIDLDGDIDLVERSDLGVAWFENLNNSGEFDYHTFAPPINEIFNSSYLTGLADMDEDGDLDFIFNDRYLLYWTENTAIHPYWLEGDLIADTILNCTYDNDDFLIYDWVVVAEKSPYQLAVVTDSLGHYRIPVDSGEWVISAIPRSDYWTPCFEDSTVTLVGLNDTITTNFYMQPNGDCGFLDWEISDNGRFRLCETNSSTIEICNYGVETLSNLQVEVVLDPLLTFENSSHPFNVISNDTIIIDLDSLAFNECEMVTIDVLTTCDSVALFTAPCINYQILPSDLCAPSDSLWDGSMITVDGYCQNDSIYFTLQNIGTGPMTMPAQHRVQIINDDIVMLFEEDDYQLDVLEVKELSYASQGLGLRLSADQSSNNPAIDVASVIVPNCDDLANNIILNWLPTENGNPFTESTCNPFFGSYDPNDKAAIPVGIGQEHNIQRNWELDYTIRFQNTGNDTAFLVVLRDTISDYLDLATFNMRGGSHDYTYTLNEERELVITFQNIELPDSTTNLAESQGFVEYTISPKSDAPFGSVIENTAYIYFDHNPPIITNTVFHTIKKPVVASTEHLEICEDNQFQSDTVIVNETIFMEYDSIHFTYIQVIPIIEIDTSIQVEVGAIFEGVTINTDTSFTKIFIGQNGCDSVVNYNISIFTNTISPEFQHVKVFPNPFSEQLQITGNRHEEDQTWRLVNTSGGIIWENQIGKNQVINSISTENIPIGVYWLEIKSNQGIGVWKIVKTE